MNTWVYELQDQTKIPFCITVNSSFRTAPLRIWTPKKEPFTDRHCNHSAAWQVQVIPLTATGGEAHVSTCVIVSETFLTSSVLWKAPFRESHLSLNPTSCSCRQNSVWSPQESKGSLCIDRHSSGRAEMGLVVTVCPVAWEWLTHLSMDRYQVTQKAMMSTARARSQTVGKWGGSKKGTSRFSGSIKKSQSFRKKKPDRAPKHKTCTFHAYTHFRCWFWYWGPCQVSLRVPALPCREEEENSLSDPVPSKFCTVHVDYLSIMPRNNLISPKAVCYLVAKIRPSF